MKLVATTWGRWAGKTFSEGVSLEDANFSIGRVDRAVEGEDL